MMHLIPADYTETLDCLSRSIAKHDVILPLVNNWNRHFLTSTTECLANSLAALYLQHTQHLGTKTTPDTHFSQVKAIHKTPNKLI